jgi:putative peptide zinc metalloprotease protein
MYVGPGPTGTRFVERPRLRPGLALKRLEAGEGAKRWVLRDPSAGYLRFGDEDAELAGMLDGTRSLAELVAETERRGGPAGMARLTELLAELQARGLLAGAGQANDAAPRGWRGLMRPRRWSVSGAGQFFERLYSRGGWALFSRPALALLGLIAGAGIFVFAYLVAGRFGTPFVVAQKVGLGGLVFVIGRLAIASVHETAHGLAMAAVGRRAGDAGVKLVLVFPYAYVDTSEAWFEPRRRRILVSAAGPVSDFTLGGLFSVLALVTAPGTLRDILFQLAFAAYVGGLFNLNPFLERDGYHILVDVLGEPALRRRAREQLHRRLRGDSSGASPVLASYSLYGLAWSTLTGLFAVGMSLRYEPRVASVLPSPLPWAVLVLVWITCFAPVIVTLWSPLRERTRRRTA